MCRPLSRGGRRCTGARPLPFTTAATSPSTPSPVSASPVASSQSGHDASTAETTTTAAVPGPGPTPAEAKRAARREARQAAREAAGEKWARVDNELRDARRAVNGDVIGTLADVLLGPVSRQAGRAENGGDPATYDERVAEGRALVRNVLIGRGDTPAEADAKVARLETVYTAWRATPEAR